MPPKRSDDPAPRTVRLSAEARRLLGAVAALLTEREGATTQTQVVERAIRHYARHLKVN